MYHFLFSNIFGKKTCTFHFEEADGIGLISALMVMTKLKMHLDFSDNEQASTLVETFAKRKRGNTVHSKGINFLQSILNIIDQGILNALQDIPLFKNDSDLVRVNNIMVITYIAHKL